MAEIIDITSELNKRAKKRLKLIKEDLQIELERLDYDIEKELNKYVIFDTSNYYELLHEEKKEVVSHEKSIKLLLTAFDMLVKLNESEAAIEVENIITRLKNNSYERSNTCQSSLSIE